MRYPIRSKNLGWRANAQSFFAPLAPASFSMRVTRILPRPLPLMLSTTARHSTINRSSPFFNAAQPTMSPSRKRPYALTMLVRWSLSRPDSLPSLSIAEKSFVSLSSGVVFVASAMAIDELDSRAYVFRAVRGGSPSRTIYRGSGYVSSLGAFMTFGKETRKHAPCV